MKFVDTHCHLDLILGRKKLSHYSELKAEFPENFEKAIHIACDEKAIPFALEVIQNEEVFCGIGIHPHDAADYHEDLHQQIIEHMKNPKVLAWGEIGLDYHYEYSPKEIQKTVFRQQLTQATQLNKPIIIHTREADEDTLEIMSEILTEDSKVHIHCFTGGAEFAQELLNLPGQIFFGFTGVITFKNAESIRESLKLVPIEQILLETDSPFMAPIPHRGKVAHPGLIPHIAEQISMSKDISLERVYEQARLNTFKMYGI